MLRTCIRKNNMSAEISCFTVYKFTWLLLYMCWVLLRVLVGLMIEKKKKGMGVEVRWAICVDSCRANYSCVYSIRVWVLPGVRSKLYMNTLGYLIKVTGRFSQAIRESGLNYILIPSTFGCTQLRNRNVRFK